MTTPDESGLVYRVVTGDFLVSVEDSDDPDRNPDQHAPTGDVTATPLLPPSGAFRRSRASGSQLVIPKPLPGKIIQGRVVDENGEDGLTLLAEVDGTPVYWSIQVSIKDNENWTIFQATYRIGEWPEGGVHLPDLVDVEVVPEPELAAIRAAEVSAARAEAAAEGLQGTLDTIQTGRLSETVLDATYLLKDELPSDVGVGVGVGATGTSLMSMLAQPVTGVTLERVSAAKYFLYSNLPGDRRIRWTLQERSPSQPGVAHQIEEVHALYVSHDTTALQVTTVDERDNATINWSGVWANIGYGSPVSGMHGGSVRRTSEAGAYAEWTTPAATYVGMLGSQVTNCGIAKVTVDGSASAANLLPTAQDLVTAGTLESSALVANGGTLNPTDRLIDFYGSPTMYAVDYPIAEGLTEEPHTVRVTCTGYKNTAASDVRVEMDAYTYGVVTGGPVETVERLDGVGSVWEYAFQVDAGGQVAWIGNDHGYDYQTGIQFEVDGNPVTLTNGQSLTGAEIVATRTSQLAHPGLGLTPGSAGEAICEWRLRGDALAITFAWTPAFSSNQPRNKLEYPMAGVSTTTNEGFIKGRTLAMDADQNLGNHDGATPGSGTTSDTALLWQPQGRLALIVHVPDTKRTFADHNMSVYLQDRSSSRTDLYMAKAYFEHLAVPIVAGKTIRGQSVYRFAWLANPDLTLAL